MQAELPGKLFFGMLLKLTGNLPARIPTGTLMGARAGFTGNPPSGVGVSITGCLGHCQPSGAVGTSRELLGSTEEKPFPPAVSSSAVY